MESEVSLIHRGRWSHHGDKVASSVSLAPVNEPFV